MTKACKRLYYKAYALAAQIVAACHIPRRHDTASLIELLLVKAVPHGGPARARSKHKHE